MNERQNRTRIAQGKITFTRLLPERGHSFPLSGRLRQPIFPNQKSQEFARTFKEALRRGLACTKIQARRAIIEQQLLKQTCKLIS